MVGPLCREDATYADNVAKLLAVLEGELDGRRGFVLSWSVAFPMAPRSWARA